MRHQHGTCALPRRCLSTLSKASTSLTPPPRWGAQQASRMRRVTRPMGCKNRRDAPGAPGAVPPAAPDLEEAATRAGLLKHGFIRTHMGLSKPSPRVRGHHSSAASQGRGPVLSSLAEAAPPMSLEALRAAPEASRQTLQRCVLGGCCIEVRHTTRRKGGLPPACRCPQTPKAFKCIALLARLWGRCRHCQSARYPALHTLPPHTVCMGSGAGRGDAGGATRRPGHQSEVGSCRAASGLLRRQPISC